LSEVGPRTPVQLGVTRIPLARRGRFAFPLHTPVVTSLLGEALREIARREELPHELLALDSATTSSPLLSSLLAAAHRLELALGGTQPLEAAAAKLADWPLLAAVAAGERSASAIAARWMWVLLRHDRGDLELRITPSAGAARGTTEEILVQLHARAAVTGGVRWTAAGARVLAGVASAASIALGTERGHVEITHLDERLGLRIRFPSESPWPSRAATIEEAAEAATLLVPGAFAAIDARDRASTAAAELAWAWTTAAGAEDFAKQITALLASGRSDARVEIRAQVAPSRHETLASMGAPVRSDVVALLRSEHLVVGTLAVDARSDFSRVQALVPWLTLGLEQRLTTTARPLLLGPNGDQGVGPTLPRDWELTPREAEVVNELLRGRAMKEIAVSLGIAPSTVQGHLGAVYKKSGARNGARLRVLAARTGASPREQEPLTGTDANASDEDHPRQPAQVAELLERARDAREEADHTHALIRELADVARHPGNAQARWTSALTAFSHRLGLDFVDAWREDDRACVLLAQLGEQQGPATVVRLGPPWSGLGTLRIGPISRHARERVEAFTTLLAIAADAVSPTSPREIEPSLPESWRLTARQREVVEAICTGLANPEIARSLGCSVHTVESHVRAILQRTGLGGRQLVAAHVLEHRSRGAAKATTSLGASERALGGSDARGTTGGARAVRSGAP
jgi:DNA-binding CsgD family transcriptional regulator